MGWGKENEKDGQSEMKACGKQRLLASKVFQKQVA